MPPYCGEARDWVRDDKARAMTDRWGGRQPRDPGSHNERGAPVGENGKLEIRNWKLESGEEKATPSLRVVSFNKAYATSWRVAIGGVMRRPIQKPNGQRITPPMRLAYWGSERKPEKIEMEIMPVAGCEARSQ